MQTHKERIKGEEEKKITERICTKGVGWSLLLQAFIHNPVQKFKKNNKKYNVLFIKII